MCARIHVSRVNYSFVNNMDVNRCRTTPTIDRWSSHRDATYHRIDELATDVNARASSVRTNVYTVSVYI